MRVRGPALVKLPAPKAELVPARGGREGQSNLFVMPIWWNPSFQDKVLGKHGTF
jgi:hypothetical protein